MSKQKICNISDLIPNSGVCALLNENMKSSIDEQVAIFYLPNTQEKVFAISNWDPMGEANVLSRGIVCHIDEELVVASPLYKQHFSLKTGQCLEEEITIKIYPVSLDGDSVYMNYTL